MRDYEVVVLIHPDLEENTFGEVIEKIQGWITDFGGSTEKVDLWGKRRLAYSIRKQREGQYALLEAKLPNAAVAEIDRNLRFLEPVMRHMIIVRD